MRKILTSLAVLLLLSGCGKTTGFASSDLEPVFMTVRRHGPASVEGNLAEDVDLRKLITALPATGVTEIMVRCTQEDSSRIREIADTLQVPVHVTLQLGENPALTLLQEGLGWKPGYSVSTDGAGNCTVEGLVIISNSTSQTWNASLVRIEDDSGEAVATTATGLVIPEGDLVVRWWEAQGTACPLSMVYGWPAAGRWSLLRPLVVPSAGPVLQDGTGPELYIRDGSDTVWVSVPGVIEVEEHYSQARNGYLFGMTVRNITGEDQELVLVHPEELPRGASFRPGEGFEERMILPPGGSRSMYYSLVYSML
jgi:hypothetical protein